MPLPLPDSMVEYLRQYGVKFVVVGHTPHGNAPTVIMHDGVTLIMGDTSFSDRAKASAPLSPQKIGLISFLFLLFPPLSPLSLSALSGDVKANRFFQGDNRGTAACSIEYRGHAWFVHGETDKAWRAGLNEGFFLTAALRLLLSCCAHSGTGPGLRLLRRPRHHTGL